MQRTYEDFVKQYGRQYPFPKSFQGNLENAHQCYFHAAMDVICKGTTYVEGFTHAWAVDSRGEVVEATWPESLRRGFADRCPLMYFGVPYRTDWLRGIVDARGGLMVRGGEDFITMPSLQYLVFDPHGWDALVAGVLD